MHEWMAVLVFFALTVFSKDPHLPRTGPLSICPLGDVSDGEDEFVGSALPMTKNEVGTVGILLLTSCDRMRYSSQVSNVRGAGGRWPHVHKSKTCVYQ